MTTWVLEVGRSDRAGPAGPATMPPSNKSHLSPKPRNSWHIARSYLNPEDIGLYCTVAAMAWPGQAWQGPRLCRKGLIAGGARAGQAVGSRGPPRPAGYQWSCRPKFSQRQLHRSAPAAWPDSLRLAQGN